MDFVHASDIHFGEPHRPAAAEAFIEAAHRLDPDAVVISGDFTQRAKVAEYEAAAAFLERLPDVPTVVTPGNHDVPVYRIFERLLAPHRNYRQYISDELDSVTRIQGATFVSLDSTAPHTAIVNGRIRRRQLDFAREAFAASPPEDVRILVAHHHFAPAPDYEGDRSMPGARNVLDALTEMGVELVLGGHLHRAYIGNSLDVFPGRRRDQGVTIVQSGTTTSGRGRAREREKNSFNRIRIGSRAVEITHYMLFEQTGRFEPFSLHAFPRRRQGWFESGTIGLPLDGASRGLPS
ncbi:MAG: metallophosphoesterase [Gemmatimonadetes bacterium]|nr:metallophosphoesterase [Gemmatimonadota bacterium]MBT8403908.1 metallophosphoesterase [Gemmatimonadota bacterium]NNK64515.1 3',5'-cyclic-nucleotide phosphodiesterase [Gemmatimonadota bacterium]